MSAHARNQRVLGMSRNVRTPQLLKSLNRPETTARETLHNKPAIREPDDIEAPPISSDEDEEEAEDVEEDKISKAAPAKTKRANHVWSSDLEEDDSPPRGDIRPTTFSKPTKEKPFGKQPARYEGVRSFREGLKRSEENSSRKSSSSKLTSRSDASFQSGVLETSLLRDSEKTYKVASKRWRSPPSKPRSQKRTKKAEAVEKEPELPKLKLPDDLFDSLDAETPKARVASLQIPNRTADSPSPTEANPPRRTLRSLSASPPKSTAPVKLDTRFLEDSPLKNSKKKKKSTKSALLDEKPRLKDVEDSVDSSAHLGKLSDSDESPLSDIDLSFDEIEENTAAAQCPYCKKPVDPDLLQTFSKGKRMPIRMQRLFCTEHKKVEAGDLWRSRGYPDIDWKALDSRISDHYNYLERILKGGRSHFGDLLARDIKEGINRNLMKADFNSSPGYYGTRGFRVMQESIFGRFSSLLRKRAVEDSLVSSRGYSLYVQAVLVPELAVRLVMEDMDVEAKEARRILEESAWIGELLCEDAGDVVDDDDDDLF